MPRWTRDVPPTSLPVPFVFVCVSSWPTSTRPSSSWRLPMSGTGSTTVRFSGITCRIRCVRLNGRRTSVDHATLCAVSVLYIHVAALPVLWARCRETALVALTVSRPPRVFPSLFATSTGRLLALHEKCTLRQFSIIYVCSHLIYARISEAAM